MLYCPEGDCRKRTESGRNSLGRPLQPEKLQFVRNLVDGNDTTDNSFRGTELPM